MTKADVVQKALELSVSERLELAVQLLDSVETNPLDETDDVQAAWSEEILRRLEEIRTGKAVLLTSEEAWTIIDADE